MVSRALQAMMVMLLSWWPLGAHAQAAPSTSLVGQLLIASASVPDGRFRHAVVLVVADNKTGTAGLILNNLGTTPLSQLFPKLNSARQRTDVAFRGGPVAPTKIFCLVRTPGPLREADLVLPGLYVSTSLSLMQLALNAGRSASTFRVFQGYTGWKPGQLQQELARRLWTVRPATAEIVFDPQPATLWPSLQSAEGEKGFLLAALTRDTGQLDGGINPYGQSKPGQAELEPFAFLSPTGSWSVLPCTSDGGATCRQFERDFLSMAHAYTIVSEDGSGARVTSLPTDLGECWDFVGKANYQGAPLLHGAIAAAQASEFDTPPPLNQLSASEISAFSSKLDSNALRKIGSLKAMRLYRTVLNGHELLILQQDLAQFKFTDPASEPIFSIFVNARGRFQLAASSLDDEEEVFATLRTNSGLDFLVAVTHDSESQNFVIYQFRGGKLAVVFNGGGNAC